MPIEYEIKQNLVSSNIYLLTRTSEKAYTSKYFRLRRADVRYFFFTLPLIFKIISPFVLQNIKYFFLCL